MPDDVLGLADRFWRAEVGPGGYHPVSQTGGLAEICDNVAFVPPFANVSAFATAVGLVLVDTGSSFFAAAIHRQPRRWDIQWLDTAVYSHGHIFTARAEAATSTMAAGVFRWAAQESLDEA